jgi:hypothetical protein
MFQHIKFFLAVNTVVHVSSLNENGSQLLKFPFYLDEHQGIFSESVLALSLSCFVHGAEFFVRR